MRERENKKRKSRETYSERTCQRERGIGGQGKELKLRKKGRLTEYNIEGERGRNGTEGEYERVRERKSDKETKRQRRRARE